MMPRTFESRHLNLRQPVLLTLIVLLMTLWATGLAADKGSEPVERFYRMAPSAPSSQTVADVDAKTKGCMSCHSQTDRMTMHQNPAVKLGCTDCHGGNASVFLRDGVTRQDEVYRQAMDEAHILPRYPGAWNTPGSANPERSYTLLNRESREFIRFMNPSDYRVAREACGACHMEIIHAAERSLMATSAMFWGGAAYNNGILNQKNYFLGEAYTADGEPARLTAPIEPTEEMKQYGILPELIPMPAWETVEPGDHFRVFERGGRNKLHLFPETGNPNVTGRFVLLEEPGRPDIRQSNRGPGTGARISVPLLNMTKTRLNDPTMWFIGTNDQPGDYRNSGCAACHVVYANDRDPRHSGVYAQFGHSGETQTTDPTIPVAESGHPLKHEFTRAIPTSQCMSCHMHQPNMFVNSYLGYTMWDYESDAPHMWPDEQQYPDDDTVRKVLDRNPEGAAPRGKWADLDFLKQVSEMNPELSDTQFADYHGHGWNFRAVFKRDRQGNLLDDEGAVVANDDPDKFDKAVHMSSIHLDQGMHCVDCHFAQDNHGNGHIYGEVAMAVEVKCVDCHGTVAAYPNLRTSGPAALAGGTDMSVLRTPDGRRRFEWVGGNLVQRSVMDPDLEWNLSLVMDSVSEGSSQYNSRAARAKLMSSDVENQYWGSHVEPDRLAHNNEEMECYVCHTSWTTSCGGCHLPIEANWKTERLHYEGGETRNYSTYNPQVARNEIFMIARQGGQQGGKYAPARSSSALVLSSTDAFRQKIYIQQPPISASGFSSQAMNTHFPHTVRKTETRVCSDCHLSEDGDNNAIVAQTLMQGTNFIDFVGYHVWVGGDGEVAGVQVTEWDEPQAVIGSYLHRYAYPDWYEQHIERDRVLQTAHTHSAGRVGCVQQRGEYLYFAGGPAGFRVFDIASVANKGVSQRIISAPFSSLGHDTHVATRNATCLDLVTTQPIHPDRNQGDLMRIDNQEQAFDPIYNYAVITDSEEGLILVDINTLADSEPRNNQLERALTWNEGGVLDGARHVTMGGHIAYVAANRGLVLIDLSDPQSPQVASIVPLTGARASALQFRYLFVIDAAGLSVIDVTRPDRARLVAENTIALGNAHNVYLARTYAYVAAGQDGLVIVDVTRPESIQLKQRYTADGAIRDAHDVIVASTNASLFAYVADGIGGLKVLQLTSPDSQPNFYGFSPEPRPELIASFATDSPAISLSRPLERDRGVDETGGQVAVFGRKGARPLTLEEMQGLYLDANGEPWFVRDDDDQ